MALSGMTPASNPTEPVQEGRKRERLSLTMWVRDRLDNCHRIAATKSGQDQRGWMEDAAYFAAILEALACPDWVDEACEANERLGPWMSAALDDPNVCAEMKADINAWFALHTKLLALKEGRDGRE